METAIRITISLGDAREGIDRILSAESVTAQQFIDKTSECIVIHSIGIDISLYARNIKKVIGVS